MKTVIPMSIALMLFIALPVQARTFADLQTDLTAAPYRVVVAVSDFHPLAALSASMRRGVASWDEFSLRVQDVAVIGWGRLVLGAEEMRASADRGLVAFVHRLFAESVPQAAVTATIGTAAPPALSQVEGPTPDPVAARWVDDMERLFRSTP